MRTETDKKKGKRLALSQLIPLLWGRRASSQVSARFKGNVCSFLPALRRGKKREDKPHGDIIPEENAGVEGGRSIQRDERLGDDVMEMTKMT